MDKNDDVVDAFFLCFCFSQRRFCQDPVYDFLSSLLQIIPTQKIMIGIAVDGTNVMLIIFFSILRQADISRIFVMKRARHSFHLPAHAYLRETTEVG